MAYAPRDYRGRRAKRGPRYARVASALAEIRLHGGNYDRCDRPHIGVRRLLSSREVNRLIE